MRVGTAITILLVTTLAAPSGTAAQEERDVVADINSLCEEEWGTDYRMQRHCRDRQTESAITFLNYTKNTEGEERAIYIRCYGEWLDADGRPDWRMALHCGERQLQSYRELR